VECGVCEIRSSIGFCRECQQLLCETCSETCDECGKLMCPDHVYESRSGKIYCNPCNERRKADRGSKRTSSRREDAAAAGGGTSLAALEEQDDLAEEDDREGRVLGQREPTQPWKLCMYTAGIALALALLLMFFPSFRRIPLGGTSYLATPYVLIIIPLIAAFWGVYGIVNIDFFKYRQRCMAGLGVAGVSMLLFVVAAATDPAAESEEEAVSFEQRRAIMDDQQLEDWRGNVLDKYR
jgi:hypothetical protein